VPADFRGKERNVWIDATWKLPYSMPSRPALALARVIKERHLPFYLCITGSVTIYAAAKAGPRRVYAWKASSSQAPAAVVVRVDTQPGLCC